MSAEAHMYKHTQIHTGHFDDNAHTPLVTDEDVTTRRTLDGNKSR